MLTSEPKLLLIGKLEALSGVPIKTIRYYEELGIIKSSGRTEGGFRLFSPDVVSRLSFIKRSQNLGFSLQQIGEILRIHDHGELPCDEVRQKIQAKVLDINARIQQLKELKSELLSLVSERKPLYHQEEGLICPIIQNFE
ncbi:MerR family DNA-binding protein [Lyngbya aestuarii]|uniref:MerR family DNA-binding protein n=1 Tax=Lyngbya aestuarii TaxID=118322 RepID=UPI00403DB844